MSFAWFLAPTQTEAPEAQNTDAILLGGLFLALQTNRRWLTDSNLKSQFLDAVDKTQKETLALLNNLDVKPPDTPDCTNTKRKRDGSMRLSEKQLRDLIDRGIIGSIGNVISSAVHDIGKLISCASNVVKSIVDAVNKSTPDLDEIQNLTDTLAAIGTDLQTEGEKENEDDNNSNSDKKSSTDDKQSSASSPSSSSSCSARAVSACDTSVSVFTPEGQTTATSSTITLSCSTVSSFPFPVSIV